MALTDLDRTRAGWWAIGLALAGALLFVVHSFVGTFVFGLFLYYGTRPVYTRLRRVGVRPASVAAAVALLAMMLPVLAIGTYAVAIGLQELDRFTRTADLGPYADIVEPYLDLSAVVDDPASLLENPDLVDALGPLFDSLLGSLGFVGTGLLHVFVMFTIAFYLLRDGPRLRRWLLARFGDDRGVLAAYVSAVDTDLSSVFFGNILNALITGAIGAIVYSLLDFFAPAGLGVPYAALLGLLAGAASLVPVVGMKLVYVPVSAFLFYDAFTSAGPTELWFPVAFAALSFVVVDTIPDLVLRPYVSGRNLHVGMVMLAYIFGPLLFGWYGIFLGPLVLVVVVHFGRVVLPALIDREPFHPAAVDPSYLADTAPGAGDTGTAGPGYVDRGSTSSADNTTPPDGDTATADEDPVPQDEAATDPPPGRGEDPGDSDGE